MTYDKYCKDMKFFKATPMSEKDFNVMQGINEDTIESFLSPKYTKLKAVKPSLKEHAKMVKL